MKTRDWLIEGGFDAHIQEKPGVLALSNGIIAQEFSFTPDFCRISFLNLHSGEEYLRSIKPEATLTIDGAVYPVGGAAGLSEHGFFKREWLAGLKAGDGFRYVSHREVPTRTSVEWKSWKAGKQEGAPGRKPTGKALDVEFASDILLLKGLRVLMHYEIYDGLPCISKELTIENRSGREITLDRFQVEILALCDPEDTNVTPPLREDNSLFISDAWRRNLFASSDMENGSIPTCRYLIDAEYTSQVNYKSRYPAMLVSAPTLGPCRRIPDGGSFTTYKAYVMAFDGPEENRRSLAMARFYGTLAPWCTENPSYLHVISVDEETVKTAVDQCAEAGFDLIILSFGSGLDMEDLSDANIGKFRALAEYAHSKGVGIGGYSLLASRRIDDETDVVWEKPIFDHAPCLGSAWGIAYLNKIETFIRETGFDLLEHDGSYPGDPCRSEKHPGHRCYEDSQYTQLEAICALYRRLRADGIYLNVPDLYFLAGNTKTGMGYKEVNWSLPRAQQRILARQNIHDGTLTKPPTMGWMFVPLTEYHGGGAAATIEPLHEHLDHYEMMLMANLLAGVQACYRGFRLFDEGKTRDMLTRCVALYKKYRAILDCPFVRIRRPDGRRLDGYVHVSTRGTTRAFAALFNPCDSPRTETIEIPLYYSGLRGRALVRTRDDAPVEYALDENAVLSLLVTVPAEWYVYYSFEAVND